MLTTVDGYIQAKLTHSLHTSEIRSFWGCKLRHHWIFREFYYPTVTVKPLEFGVAFHGAMEVLYEPTTWDDLEVAAALALTRFRDICAKQRDAFAEQQGELSEEAATDYKERLELGIGMLKYYIRKVMPQMDRNFKPVRVEAKFEVPIEDPRNGNQLWCKCDVCWGRYIKSELGTQDHNKWQEAYLSERLTSPNAGHYREKIWQGLPVTYGGRVDMLAQDELGRYWIFDWKTCAMLSPDGDEDYMLLDLQITSYCWALQQEIGLEIAGFVYAEIRKAVPAEPEPMKVRRLGRLYSIGKTQVYEKETYKRTVEENDPIAYGNGLYDEYLQFLEETDVQFHRRHQIHRTPVELANAAMDIYMVALDITDPNIRVYPEPGRFHCRTCAFFEPCYGRRRGEDIKYMMSSLFEKRSYHYWEDVKPSTETKGGQ